MAITKKQYAALTYLREQGFLVVAWTPEELKSVDLTDMEDYLTSKGNDFIENNSN